MTPMVILWVFNLGTCRRSMTINIEAPEPAVTLSSQIRLSGRLLRDGFAYRLVALIISSSS